MSKLNVSEGLEGWLDINIMLIEVKSWFITREIKVGSLETVTCNSSSISSVSVHNISDIIGNKKGRSNLAAMFKHTQKCFRFCKQNEWFSSAMIILTVAKLLCVISSFALCVRVCLVIFEWYAIVSNWQIAESMWQLIM